MKALFLWFMLCLPAFAAERLTNADIVAMVQGKVPKDVIIQKIADCEPNFLLAAANLVDLVSKGVQDDIVRAMTARQRGTSLPGSLRQNSLGTMPPAAPTESQLPADSQTDNHAELNSGTTRVYVTDSQSWEMRGGWSAGGHGGNWGGSGYMSGGARPQTAEIIKTINQRCPGVTVTNRVEKADFAITLDHEGGKGLLRRRNKLVVFNRNGDAVFSDSTRELGNSVKDACAAISANSAQPVQNGTRPMPPSTSRPTADGLVNVPFSSNPPGSLVSFSGTRVCYTPCVVKLEARRFEVTMSLAGYADWTREITVEPGKPIVADLQH